MDGDVWKYGGKRTRASPAASELLFGYVLHAEVT